MRRFVLAAFSLFAGLHGWAQEIPVHVSFAGDDSVGERLAFQIKDEIRKSGAFDLEYDPDQAVFKLSLITLDPEESYTQSYTVYSIAYLVSNPDAFDYYITSFVGTCGTSKISSCATELVQELGIWAERFQEAAAQSAAVSDPFVWEEE